MPSGRVHAAATVAAAGLLSPLLVVAAHQAPLCAAAFGLGCLVGVVINPDLDVRRGTYSWTVVRRTFGSIAGWLWALFWFPYARLIPRHRHLLSHLPLLGTGLRLLYLLAFFALGWLLLGRFVELPAFRTLVFHPLALWAAAGLAVVDALHSAMDRIF